MNGPDHGPQPPAALKARVIRSLRSRGVLRPEGAWVRRVGQLAAALVIFAAGTLVGRATANRAPTSDEPQFLLALHEDERFTPERTSSELVREYSEWAAGLARQGQLVAAEQLDGSVTVLPAGDADVGGEVSAGIGEMTGFFLIRAPSFDDAVATALTHPHLGYGGRMVLRGVVR